MARIAIIDKSKCKPNSCNFECKRVCPVNMTGGDCVTLGEDNKANIDEILCTGCGICPKHCPFDAITIINLPELKNQDPIHQYGPNGFRIYNLPLIQEGTITGILGRNGIGKSTVINVLSNNIKANFGKFGKDKIEEENYFKVLNEKFKGTALQNYFNKLEKEEIKISYKPQQIINIPKIFKGKVLELLKKTNSDENKIYEISKELGIENILDRDISVISGGELQRVAILASLLKENSNLFIFDEITNYLDIYQRLNSSRLIKERVKDKTALVVEHDLIVLDYLTDFIHIMYGEPGAFGMLTGIKASKVGINTYLEGYSKEENVRFRDKPITFEKDSVGESQRVEVTAVWEDENIERGNFKLKINKGDIKKGEIIGIIGENGLGKSTFIDHIANKGFENKIISYKPQLIERNDELVISILSQFNNFSDNFYKLYVLDPLNIDAILEKEISTLSGGELQRFAIAKCLLEDADIYLLDEPTAFLDIEDRLKIAKMIKNFIQLKEKSAFIIDHDLVFMDYLSDKLQVFLGEPSIKGEAHSPLKMREGMNLFLKKLNITFRRDENNKRPRVNKPGSVKDSEQKQKGEYYYV
jgi:ATP-binding cassette subfamily E protein 1